MFMIRIHPSPSKRTWLELAQFSVSEHNKEAKTKLVFERVVSGRSALLLGGTYYELIVKAKDESQPTASAASY
ncbi:cysteine proteinase inhibitor 5-like [Pyrus ussuriensis x Pyrus communis]|uniref:Cysteine proteinase inhibitor 5-like n=1 Tax=Pyrus ussuriensis x Pyrus communis TaxID=2448454 RepID=A0A5N5GTM8_9ROSA|nr:cysteine proteinase inhibitor 5-like [Pyrus ussuriensis x Pyrus communis]